MKTLDLSAAVSPNIFFPTSGTVNFLQSAYTEAIAQSLIAQIGSGYSASVPYILYGCAATVGGSTTSITAGAIFYNGEVYIVGAQTITNPTTGNVILCNLGVTNTFLEPGGATCDPASFSDGLARNVHNIRSVTYVTGVSGGAGDTGYMFDFASAVVMPLFTTAATLASELASLTSTVTGLNAALDAFTGTWTAAPFGIVASGGSINTSGAGVVVYNKYVVAGNTLDWQIQVRGATVTITGTLSGLRIGSPVATTPSGGPWINNNAYVLFSYNQGSGRMSSFCQLSGVGGACIELPNGVFSAGTLDLDISIRAEVDLTY